LIYNYLSFKDFVKVIHNLGLMACFQKEPNVEKSYFKAKFAIFNQKQD